MPADPHLYDSERLARCYSQSRPPVHEVICARLFDALPRGLEIGAVLDVGCGAGASTAPLVAHATSVTGIDPSLPMLRQARRRLPTARFIEGTADALPAGTASMDLVTAAGSLNYADIDLSLAEIARVLSLNGYLALYDFSTGRVLPGDAQTDSRFLAFERLFPWPAGYALDYAGLPYAAHGLSRVLHDTFTVRIRMSADDYLDYVMGETNVEAAISGGLSELEARESCRRIFEPLFEGGPRTVGFASVLAVARKTSTIQA